jgi:hypothetical protein
MRPLRRILKLLNHPLLSATGNLLLLITGVPLVLAAALTAAGLLIAEPVLVLIAVALFVLDALLVAAVWLRQAPAPEPTRPTSDDNDRNVFLAVEAEVALAQEEALEMIKLLRAEWPHVTVEGALVQTALPDWRAKTTAFIGIVLGSAQRAAFKAANAGANDLERIESERRFLDTLGRGLTASAIRVDEEEFLLARATRRNHEAAAFLHYENHRAPGAPPPVDLRRQIDELMRRGMDIVAELSEPAVPTEPTPGVWKLSGGDAPDGWWDKADDFLQECRTLLKAHQPALLKDFEEGFNSKIHESGPTRSDHAVDKGPDAQRMLALADAERSTPRRVVEATLDGLTGARRRLG